MTTSQISHILSKYNYSMDEKVDLAKFSMIILDQDSNLYPDTKKYRFEFDSSNKMLKVYCGKTKYNNFVYDNSSTPNHIISLDAIAGFVQTTKILDNGALGYHA